MVLLAIATHAAVLLASSLVEPPDITNSGAIRTLLEVTGLVASNWLQRLRGSRAAALVVWQDPPPLIRSLERSLFQLHSLLKFKNLELTLTGSPQTTSYESALPSWIRNEPPQAVDEFVRSPSRKFSTVPKWGYWLLQKPINNHPSVSWISQHFPRQSEDGRICQLPLDVD